MTSSGNDSTTGAQSSTPHSTFSETCTNLKKTKYSTQEKQYVFTFSLGAIGVFHRKFQLLYELTAIHTPFLPDVKQSFQGLFAALICFSVQRLKNNYSSAGKYSLCFKRASSKLAAASIAMFARLERVSLILSETNCTKHICGQFSPLPETKDCLKVPHVPML